MRKITILFSALLALALPAAAQAHQSGPSKADHAAAVKACRAERGTTDASKAAFAQKYGTNGNKKNAFGKCVSQQAKAKAKHQARLRKEQSSSTTAAKDDDDAAADDQENKADDDQGDDDGHNDQGDDDSQDSED